MAIDYSSEAFRNSRPKRGDRRMSRSAISNGSRIMPRGVDARSGWVRRMRDIHDSLLSELGEATSEEERSLVRRIAVLTTELERLEVKLAQAGGNASSADVDVYSRASGTLKRLWESLKLEHRQHDDDDPARSVEREIAESESVP